MTLIPGYTSKDEEIEALRRERDELKWRAAATASHTIHTQQTVDNLHEQLAAERDCSRQWRDEYNAQEEDFERAIGLQVELLNEALAREQQLRKALHGIGGAACYEERQAITLTALALPHDDTALKQYGAKLLRDAAASSICFDKMQFFVSYLNREADALEKS